MEIPASVATSLMVTGLVSVSTAQPFLEVAIVSWEQAILRPVRQKTFV
ncbi:hypothetical protein [Pseudarthrobacter sp. NamE2]|nr:hypothetical protein [Pseudarthrobacter sp. NamE2]